MLQVLGTNGLACSRQFPTMGTKIERDEVILGIPSDSAGPMRGRGGGSGVERTFE